MSARDHARLRALYLDGVDPLDAALEAGFTALEDIDTVGRMWAQWDAVS